MKKIVFFLAVTLTLSACTNSEKTIHSEEGEVSSSVAAGEESDAELKAAMDRVKKEEEEKANQEATSLTSMKFDKLLHDFGNIKVDTDNKATFTVTNTGTNPLIINDVSVSCGCTTAEKPEKPILPGKSDKISVVFHPKPGQLKEQKKTITVTANADPKIVVLDIKAFVSE